MENVREHTYSAVSVTDALHSQNAKPSAHSPRTKWSNSQTLELAPVSKRHLSFLDLKSCEFVGYMKELFGIKDKINY
jgi:hypothetical protein